MKAIFTLVMRILRGAMHMKEVSEADSFFNDVEVLIAKLNSAITISSIEPHELAWKSPEVTQKINNHSLFCCKVDSKNNRILVINGTDHTRSVMQYIVKDIALTLTKAGRNCWIDDSAEGYVYYAPFR